MLSPRERSNRAHGSLSVNHPVQFSRAISLDVFLILIQDRIDALFYFLAS
jgi:hypothetical protein